MPEPLQRFRLDLLNPLAAEPEHIPDFLERLRAHATNAVQVHEHVAFALTKRCEHTGDVDARINVLCEHRITIHRIAGVQLLHQHVQLLRADRRARNISPPCRPEMLWNPDRRSLLTQVLANPRPNDPRSVGEKPVVLLRVDVRRRVDQRGQPDLKRIVSVRWIRAHVLHARDHEPRIRRDETRPRLLVPLPRVVDQQMLIESRDRGGVQPLQNELGGRAGRSVGGQDRFGHRGSGRSALSQAMSLAWISRSGPDPSATSTVPNGSDSPRRSRLNNRNRS